MRTPTEQSLAIWKDLASWQIGQVKLMEHLVVQGLDYNRKTIELAQKSFRASVESLGSAFEAGSAQA